MDRADVGAGRVGILMLLQHGRARAGSGLAGLAAWLSVFGTAMTLPGCPVLLPDEFRITLDDGAIEAASDSAGPSPDTETGLTTDAEPDGRGLDALATSDGRDGSRDAIADSTTVDVLAADAAGDVADGGVADSAPKSDASLADAPACSSSQSFVFQTAPSGCMCESPPTYSCYAWGTVCGTCPPNVDADAFGHADGSCQTPNVCRVGAPCAWENPTGGVVAGSVVTCP